MGPRVVCRNDTICTRGRPEIDAVRSAAGDTIRSNAFGLTGTVAEVRGDTLVLRDPKMNGAPLRFTSPVSGAAVEATTVLIVPENHATLATRRLEGGRTALLVLGATVVTLGILAAIATTEISNGY